MNRRTKEGIIFIMYAWEACIALKKQNNEPKLVQNRNSKGMKHDQIERKKVLGAHM